MGKEDQGRLEALAGRRPVPWFALLALSACLVAAAPPARKPDVPALVRQLGSDEYAEREAATRALERAGPDAVPALARELRTTADLEVRRRVQRILAAIERTLYRELRAFAGHSVSVNGVAVAPDGKTAATGDLRGVRLWDLATGKELRKSEEHGDRVMAVAFSPDGKRLASASEDRTVRLWDASTLEELRVYRGHTAAVRGLAFSRDGKLLLSGGMDGTLRLWDVDTGNSRRVINVQPPGPGAPRRVMAVALTPDGRRAIHSGPNDAAPVVWDLQTGKPVGTLAGHKNWVMGLAVSPDGKQALTASHDRTVRLWDLATLKQTLSLEGHEGEVTSIAFSPDGKKAVSGGLDKKVCVWDLAGARLIRALPGHEKQVWCVAFAPDGRHGLSGGQDATMRLWVMGK